jgi:hypothetical protein
VGVGLEDRRDQIAESPGGNDRQPAEPDAEELAEKDAEERAESDVRQEVAEIGMEPERSRRPPPFAAGDEAGLRGAGGKPVEAEQHPVGGGLDEDQHRGENQRAVDHPRQREGRRLRRLRPVLGGVFLQLIFGALGVGRGDQEPDPPGPADQQAIDAHCNQNERMLFSFRLLPELPDFGPTLAGLACQHAAPRFVAGPILTAREERSHRAGDHLGWRFNFAKQFRPVADRGATEPKPASWTLS